MALRHPPPRPGNRATRTAAHHRAPLHHAARSRPCENSLEALPTKPSREVAGGGHKRPNACPYRHRSHSGTDGKGSDVAVSDPHRHRLISEMTTSRIQSLPPE